MSKLERREYLIVTRITEQCASQSVCLGPISSTNEGEESRASNERKSVSREGDDDAFIHSAYRDEVEGLPIHVTAASPDRGPAHLQVHVSNRRGGGRHDLEVMFSIVIGKTGA